MNNNELNTRQTIQLLILSFSAVFALFLWQGHQGFSLWDEGFLWYGAQRVMLGEVPIRDFMAYDPGRYYWSATLMTLFADNGIIALRGALAVFQILGLFLGLRLLILNQTKSNIFFLLLATVTLVIWMFPRHKLFDISLSIALIAALTFLIQYPSKCRYFMTGLFIGLVAVFGRNHGIYGLIGSLGTMAYLALPREESHDFFKNFALWAVGIVVGYLPVLAMVLFVPGFDIAYWESIRFIFESKSTNLPLPIPWPWLILFEHLTFVASLRGVLTGLFFVLIVAFGVLGIVFVVWQKLQRKLVSPTLIASVFLALPYAHYAYSRADIGHLAQGIFPFLFGMFALLATRTVWIKWPLGIILCGTSVLLMLPLHPGWFCRISQQCTEVNVSGSKLQVDRGTATDLALLSKLSYDYAPNGRNFITTPFWPGAYAAFERKSPMWEIFALWPRSDSFQKAEIERIKEATPGFVLVQDFPLDGREELRFKNTHPIMDQYFRDHFDFVPEYSQKSGLQIYKNKIDQLRIDQIP